MFLAEPLHRLASIAPWTVAISPLPLLHPLSRDIVVGVSWLGNPDGKIVKAGTSVRDDVWSKAGWVMKGGTNK